MIKGVEWPTLTLVAVCYVVWASATTWLTAFSPTIGVLALALSVALFGSLQHEIIHRHPFQNKRLNEVLAFPGLLLLIPYLRFRDTHLAHHFDAELTDPFDDPESNYMCPQVWSTLSKPMRALLRFNNTLLGRCTIGVLISQAAFMRADWRAIRAGDRQVLHGWLWHIPSLGLVFLWMVFAAQMPILALFAGTYLGLCILKIRTFLEHQAHNHTCARTAIVEDRGPLALLFLNNNFHLVHHMNPDVPWYRLPKLYFATPARYSVRNDGYTYASYGEVFRRHFMRTKDPVPHPLMEKLPQRDSVL